MRGAALALAAAACLLLAGCAPTVSLQPAPQATSVRCADVVVRLPPTVQGLDRRTTDAQGTAAWGPDPAITLVCGVRRSPSSDCGTIDDIDWTNSDTAVPGARVLTTYGRSPVIQVVKPTRGRSGTAAVDVADVLRAVSDAVKDGTRATGARCGAATPAPS